MAIAVIAIQWIIFKVMYPFPDFFSDSYSYIFAAAENLSVNTWPIGYSKFLHAFHQITYSDNALVTFQYALFEFASLHFFFTVLYLFRTTDKQALSIFWTNIIFIFLFIDPLSPYISNYINSDPLFAGISLLWFTQLIWIIHYPKNYQIITQAVLLFLAFTIRNNAYYYPILTILAFALSQQSLVKKTVGALAGIILITLFVYHTEDAAYQMTGTRQFSLFTGWQLANNALYMYDKINVDSNELPTPQARQLDYLAKGFFSRNDKEKFNTFLYSHPGNLFIQFSVSPLKEYLREHYKDTDEYSSIVNWGKASADFDPFGSYLIKTHPIAFTRYFILPNARNYFLPDLEKLEHYNLGSDSVYPLAKSWFHYDSLRINSVSKDLQGALLFLCPLVFLVSNLGLLLLLTWYIIKKKHTFEQPAFNKSLLLVATFGLTNFSFGVFATILVLRYEFIPMIILFVFGIIMLDRVEKYKKRPASRV